MNITGLGSTSWYTSLRSTTTTTGSDASASTSASDSAAISTAGFAALLQEQGNGPPPISDELAAKIGSSLQEKNSDLFSALDSDGNGTLSASELKTGMDALHGSQGRPSGPPPSGPPPGMSDEDAAKVGSSLKSSNSKMFSALDTNQDGTVSAAELQAGMDSLHQAMDANGMGPQAGGANGAGSSGNSDSDTVKQLLDSLSSDGQSDYSQNLINDLLKSLTSNSAA